MRTPKSRVRFVLALAGSLGAAALALAPLGTTRADPPAAPPAGPPTLPTPPAPPAYRVVPVEATWGTIEGTCRLPKAIEVPTIVRGEADRDLPWTEHISPLVAFDREKLTLAGCVAFLRAIPAGKGWSKGWDGERRQAEVAVRDGFCEPYVSCLRIGTDLILRNDDTAERNLKGYLTPLGQGPRNERTSLVWNVILSAHSKGVASDETHLGRAGRYEIRPDT